MVTKRPKKTLQRTDNNDHFKIWYTEIHLEKAGAHMEVVSPKVLNNPVWQ